jgi:hypothetical protein
MPLYWALSSQLDAGSMLPQIADEIVDRKARVVLIATRRDDVSCGEIAVNGCDELGCQFRKMSPD